MNIGQEEGENSRLKVQKYNKIIKEMFSNISITIDKGKHLRIKIYFKNVCPSIKFYRKQ